MFHQMEEKECSQEDDINNYCISYMAQKQDTNDVLESLKAERSIHLYVWKPEEKGNTQQLQKKSTNLRIHSSKTEMKQEHRYEQELTNKSE